MVLYIVPAVFVALCLALLIVLIRPRNWKLIKPFAKFVPGKDYILNIYLNVYKRIKKSNLVMKRAEGFGIFLSGIDIELDLDSKLIVPKASYAFTKGFEHDGFENVIPHDCVNNLTPGYFKAVRKGLLGIREDIVESSGKAHTSKRRKQLKAMLVSCEAVIEFSKSIAEKAKEMVDSERDVKRKELYEEKLRILEKVPLYPAKTFTEAMQSLWVVQMLAWMEGNHYLGFGRLDQYLYPYYKKDLEEKRITKEHAYSIIEDFFRQLDAEVNRRTHEVYGDTGQTIVVGGLKPDGSDGTNDLSYMFLRAREDIRGLDPKVLVRVHSSTPASFLSEACQLSRIGMGYPTFCNDEVIVQALTTSGYPVEDARDYTVGGCWEPIIPGKSYDVPNAGKVVFLKCLEAAMNAGVSFINPSQRIGTSKTNLAQYNNFEQLKEALQAEIRSRIKEIVAQANQRYYLELMASPFLSILVDNCIEKGVDISEGGAKYNNWGILGASLANCADAMLVIKRVIFEEKTMRPEELLQVLKHDYQGSEDLRQRFINKFPKFGNDIDEVDIIARDIADFFCEKVRRVKNRYGRNFKPALASENGYIMASKDIGASADGRKAKSPYGVNFSSSLGVDKLGPTALIKSCTKIDLKKAANGAVIDVKFHPRTVSGEIGLEKFAALIKGFIALGGSQIQFNIVSREMLLDAQKNPERYGDLIVRVWGFSAYFVRLPEEYQEHIIARTEH